MKRWCILNLTTIRETEIPDSEPLGMELVEGCNENILFYSSRDEAENDLLLLKEKFKFAEFYERIRRIDVRFIRDADYMKTWKGDQKITGGFMYMLFIHYIDLAWSHGAMFTGDVRHEGNGFRRSDIIDLDSFNQDDLYHWMYQGIIAGHGTKARHLSRMWNRLQVIDPLPDIRMIDSGKKLVIRFDKFGR